MASGVTVLLVVALAWAVWWLVGSSRREQRRERAVADYARRYQVDAGFIGDHESPAHLFRGQGECVTVAELLEEAVERGDGIRLNWPEDNLDDVGRVRPYVRDQFPTAVLPPVICDEDW